MLLRSRSFSVRVFYPLLFSSLAQPPSHNLFFHFCREFRIAQPPYPYICFHFCRVFYPFSFPLKKRQHHHPFFFLILKVVATVACCLLYFHILDFFLVSSLSYVNNANSENGGLDPLGFGCGSGRVLTLNFLLRERVLGTSLTRHRSAHCEPYKLPQNATAATASPWSET